MLLLYLEATDGVEYIAADSANSEVALRESGLQRYVAINCEDIWVERHCSNICNESVEILHVWKQNETDALQFCSEYCLAY